MTRRQNAEKPPLEAAFLTPGVGLEPTTYGLTIRRAAIAPPRIAVARERLLGRFRTGEGSDSSLHLGMAI